MGSLFKKGKSILKNGLEPYQEGKHNYDINDPKTEERAKRRFSVCDTCDELLPETIDFFKVKDERIPGASEKMCGDCGCSIPYLLRQDSKVCKKWHGTEA